MWYLIPLVIILLYTMSEREDFGWSCTFNPSTSSKVDMGTVRDQGLI